MSEYIINGTLLTNIADAVRSVDGSTSTLTPQQMETRLKAIKSSIDSALSALTAKEVEVPSDSTIHRLAELITSIEAGGGENIATGTITFPEGQYTGGGTAYILIHELGRIPNNILWFIKESTSVNESNQLIGAYKVSFEYISPQMYSWVGSSNSSTTAYANMYHSFKIGTIAEIIYSSLEADEHTIKLFVANGYRPGSTIPATSTIQWFVW